MSLYCDTDTAYIVQPNVQIRYDGYFYLSNKPPPFSIKRKPYPNGTVLDVYKTLLIVLTSAAEAETGGVFHNS